MLEHPRVSIGNKRGASSRRGHGMLLYNGNQEQFAVRPGKWAPVNAISIGSSPFARPHVELVVN
jgi:hypothetical protein